MSQWRSAWLAWALCLLSAVCSGLAILFAALSPYERDRVMDVVWPALCLALPYPIVGAFIASRQPRNAIGWICCGAGVLQGLNIFAGQYSRYALLVRPGALPAGPEMHWIEEWTWIPSLALLLPFLLLLFPSGHLPSQRWRVVAWLAALGLTLSTVAFAVGVWPVRGLPSLCAQQEVEAAQAVLARVCPPGSERREEGFVFLFGFGGIVIIGVAALLSIIALMIRFRRSRGVVRQQLKWFAYAGVLAFVGIVSTFTPFDFNRIPLRLGVMTIPIAVGIAMLRYRLYDIDLVINRTLVYGALTACVVGLYMLIVSYLSLLFQTSASFLISLGATGVVAVLFQPLRVWLQRAVNRLLYGDRDDPYAVLARLGQRLEATLAPDTVLPAIVLTVAEAFKLPYAALALTGSAGLTVAAAHGTPTDTPLHLPLSYQNEPVGELRLATRAAGEAFSPADRRLLSDLARQAGVAAYAVQLTTDLQRANAELLRSRARLVTAREEERRRLRRDLHDGLGPALAAQTLKVGTAKYLVTRDPAAAEALLTELEADIGAALAAIRQVVYNLRPPALDELGLVGAIRASAAQYAPQRADAGGGDDRGGLRMVVEAPERLAALPAAVEVAAYRIVQEALANVVRHAHAQTCQIQLALVQQGEQMLLCLDITDTGCGLPPTRHQGVGLAAMRERAAELGGSCVVAPGPTGGTWVQARLPLPQPPEPADQDRVAQ